MDFLYWLESTRIATLVRESGSIWAYPSVLFLHTLGLATVAGLSSALDLRVLGFARKVPLASLSPFITAIWVGLAVTAASGTALLVADASLKLRSPVFYVKLVFVAIALVNLRLLSTQVFRHPQADAAALTRRAHVLAASSLVCWVGATTAGRLMAYLGPAL